MEMLHSTIVKMAKYYIRKRNATFKTVSEKFNVSTRVVSDSFNETLKEIDPKLYGKVQGKKAANVLKSRSNFGKKCWLRKLFKR